LGRSQQPDLVTVGDETQKRVEIIQYIYVYKPLPAHGLGVKDRGLELLTSCMPCKRKNVDLQQLERFPAV
jgi:hypothetical protein